MDDLEQRIRLLERKIEREKRARQTAEVQLEEYSRQIFIANQSLQRALENQKKRATELEYLAASSAQTISDESLDESIRYFVELTSHFCEAEVAIYYIPEAKNTASSPQDHLWTKQTGWVNQQDICKTIEQYLPNLTGDNHEWLICPADLKLPNHSKMLNWIYYLSFQTDNDEIGWLALLSDKDFIDESMLYVLNTSKDHLLNGVKRHLVEDRILRRNEQLQDTIEQLKIAQNQLVQSEKMAVLGQMAAGVAHEINNPIAYINSNLQVLGEYWESISNWQQAMATKTAEQGAINQSEYQQAITEFDCEFILEDANEILTSAQDGIQRVKEIVSSLKTFTHQGPENFIATRIQDCIETSVRMASSAISPNCSIEQQVRKNLPEIMANPSQIQQVLINLLVNADHALQPSGGTISIQAYPLDEQVVIEISDTGCGMDEATIDKLFTPFFTTKAVGEGTGLGLSVSFAILEAHQATIEVDSTPGKGTTFILSFVTQQRELELNPE